MGVWQKMGKHAYISLLNGIVQTTSWENISLICHQEAPGPTVSHALRGAKEKVSQEFNSSSKILIKI